MRCVVVLIFMSSAATPVSAGADKAQYELQERCGKRAEQVFSRDWPNGSPDNSLGYTVMASYQSHYNQTLNRCFIIETSISHQKDEPLVIKILFDANSNKEYAKYVFMGGRLPPACNFGEKICRSEKEWDSMANFYMEEGGAGLIMK